MYKRKAPNDHYSLKLGLQDAIQYSLTEPAAGNGGRVELCDQEATADARDGEHYWLAEAAEGDGAQTELCDQQATEGAEDTRLHAALLAHVRAYVTVLLAHVRAGL